MSKWNKINENGNTSLLIKKGKATTKTLYTLWLKLQNEFLSTHGIHKTYGEYLKIKLRYIKRGAEFLQTQSKDVLQEMRLLEMDMLKLESKFKGGMTFAQMYGWLTNTNKIYLPLNTTSVNEYHYIMNQAIKTQNNG